MKRCAKRSTSLVVVAQFTIGAVATLAVLGAAEMINDPFALAISAGLMIWSVRLLLLARAD